MKSRPIDVNCDLAEGETFEQTRLLLANIDSANIACGGHAGSPEHMRATLAAARRMKVRTGAHPGHHKGGGRAAINISRGEFEGLLEDQYGFFATLCQEEGCTPSHIKLHGALYHLVEEEASLRHAFLDFVAQQSPIPRVYARAEGMVIAEASARGLEAWGEVFADRGYSPSGELLPRSSKEALITDNKALRAQIQRLLDHGEVVCVGGDRLSLTFQTICVHGDGPLALEALQMLRESRRDP